jgi:hypothetical protein
MTFQGRARKGQLAHPQLNPRSINAPTYVSERTRVKETCVSRTWTCVGTTATHGGHSKFVWATWARWAAWARDAV